MIVVSTHTDPAQKWRAGGTEFYVQEFSSSQGRAQFRLETPDGTPALVDAAELRLIDNSIPPGWALRQSADSLSYVLGPPAWQQPGFWERWMDKDSDTAAEYQRFRSGPLRVTKGESGMVTPVIELCFSADTPSFETLMPSNGQIDFELTVVVSDGSNLSEGFNVTVTSNSKDSPKGGAILVDAEGYSFSKVRLELERLVQNCARASWDESVTALSERFRHAREAERSTDSHSRRSQLKLQQSDDGALRLDLGTSELEVIQVGLREALEELDEWEFETRTGCSRQEMQSILTDLVAQKRRLANDQGSQSRPMIKELDTVRLKKPLTNGLKAGILAVVLSVHDEAELSYEIEVVDSNGRTLFFGPVKADVVEQG